MRGFYGWALLAIGLGTPAFAGDADVAKLRAILASHILPCGGEEFPASLTRADLVAAFGAQNVQTDTRPGAEGQGPGTKETILFPKKLEDRLQFAWSNDTSKSDRNGRGVASIFVEVDASDPAAVAKGLPWRGPAGLHIGSTIADMEKANGKPFTFHGLGWDYGGVYNWEGGVLDGKPGGCAVTVTFMDNPKVPEAKTSKIQGEHAFKSGDRVLRAADPIASALLISLKK